MISHQTELSFFFLQININGKLRAGDTFSRKRLWSSEAWLIVALKHASYDILRSIFKCLFISERSPVDRTLLTRVGYIVMQCIDERAKNIKHGNDQRLLSLPVHPCLRDGCGTCREFGETSVSMTLGDFRRGPSEVCSSDAAWCYFD